MNVNVNETSPARDRELLLRKNLAFSPFWGFLQFLEREGERVKKKVEARIASGRECERLLWEKEEWAVVTAGELKLRRSERGMYGAVMESSKGWIHLTGLRGVH